MVLVGIDDNAADLRREALVHVIDEALAAESLQPLSTPPMRLPLPPARINPVTLETMVSS